MTKNPFKSLVGADRDAYFWIKKKLGLGEYQMGALVWFSGLIIGILLGVWIGWSRQLLRELGNHYRWMIKPRWRHCSTTVQLHSFGWRNLIRCRIGWMSENLIIVILMPIKASSSLRLYWCSRLSSFRQCLSHFVEVFGVLFWLYIWDGELALSVIRIMLFAFGALLLGFSFGSLCSCQCLIRSMFLQLTSVITQNYCCIYPWLALRLQQHSLRLSFSDLAKRSPESIQPCCYPQPFQISPRLSKPFWP